MSSKLFPAQDIKVDDIKENDTEQIVDYRVMKNPYIIIIGIIDYEKPRKSLPQIQKDIDNMKTLWKNKYKFKNVSCASDVIGSTFITRKSLDDYINNRVSEIQLFKKKLNIDGLIFIYSGHGGNAVHLKNNFIISSDGYGMPLSDIQNKFATTCSSLLNHPKIFYMDCCRGQQKIKNVGIHQIGKGGHDSTIYVNKLSDIFVHYATSDDHEAFAIDTKTGSYLINAIYQCYTNQYENHKKKLMTLHNTSIKINVLINKLSKGTQTAEISNKLLYDVYITTNDKPITEWSAQETLDYLKGVDGVKNRNEFELSQACRHLSQLIATGNEQVVEIMMNNKCEGFAILLRLYNDRHPQTMSFSEAQKLKVPNKEAYIHDAEFQQIFGMTKQEFYRQRPWKQKNLKTAKGLF